MVAAILDDGQRDLVKPCVAQILFALLGFAHIGDGAPVAVHAALVAARLLHNQRAKGRFEAAGIDFAAFVVHQAKLDAHAQIQIIQQPRQAVKRLLIKHDDPSLKSADTIIA